MTPFLGIIELTYNTKLSKRRVSLLHPIISFLFLYNQYLLKQIDQLPLELFNETNLFNRPLSLRCPSCGHTLVAVKDRKHFRIHNCINSKCHYHRQNHTKLPKNLNDIACSELAHGLKIKYRVP
jgi:hypothetical protein